MFRLWARTFQNNHMLNDTVICDDREETRTHKVFDALQEVCMQFDLANQSGSTAISMISAAMPKHASARILLLRKLTSITWKSR